MQTKETNSKESKGKAAVHERSFQAERSMSAAANEGSGSSGTGQGVMQQLANNSRQVLQQKAMQELADDSPQSEEAMQFHLMANAAGEDGDEKPSENNTGLPDNLKAGIEQLSGYSLDDVKVHFNSAKPAQYEARAYAQGTDIYVGPGEERHLPHEAWHVVQQKQGRVKATKQINDGVNVNDDAGLEKEADMMGAKAMQQGEGAATKEVKRGGTANVVVQRVYDGVTKLRIGVIYEGSNIDVTANQLPAHTHVWVLSNGVDTDKKAFKKEVPTGYNKTTPNQIISANAGNVAAEKLRNEEKDEDELIRGVFQSGGFKIPRQNKPTNRNELDYSYWRYAAIESYIIWYDKVGKDAGWPDIRSDKTLVETIDTDITGMTGETNAGRAEEDGKSMKTDWLAESGVYEWDWTEVKDVDSIVTAFTKEEGLDIAARDAALEEFSKNYLAAEVEARTRVSGDPFNIYFPEPATRISSSAISLLTDSGFGEMKITKGQQIGHKRESIGLIAGLVHLDVTKNKSKVGRSKKKLKFDPSYVVKTGLGARKDAYVSIFIQWYKAKEEGKKLDFSSVKAAIKFDQSYLDPDQAQRVNGWHTNTYLAMKNAKPAEQAKAFFAPKA